MTKKPGKKKPVSLKIAGLIVSEAYQRCKLFSEKLYKHHKTGFQQPSITGFLDMDWHFYLNTVQKQLGGRAWEAKDVVVFKDNVFLGGENELFDTFKNYLYKNPSAEKIRELAQKEYAQWLNRDNLLYTYMHLSRGGEYLGTLLYQLRYDLLPGTCTWFTELCTHERFSYTGARIHRVCKNGWFQSGEMVNQSQWSLQSLDDENYSYKHDRRGALSFANEGKHSSKFQFFVTFNPAEWMDGRYVAFGRVVEGFDTLRRIENTPCTYEKPDSEIIITHCGLANVGLGRAIDPTLRLKGITVGQPHIHLEFFVEMLFSKFNDVLYERLDDEVKRMMEEGRWLEGVLWDKFVTFLERKRPIEDRLDPRDVSSETLLWERYIAGLYSLQDIPDLFIMRLLNGLIKKAVEASEAGEVARGVVDLLVKEALDTATMTERIAEGIVDALVKEVLRIVFGPESILRSTLRSREDSAFRISLQEFTMLAGLGESSVGSTSSSDSVVAFIRAVLLEVLARMGGN